MICTIEEYYKKRKSKCIKEAIELACSIKNRLGRDPKITDFKEEWSLFFRKEDFEKYPEMRSIIEFRLKDKFEAFFSTHKPSFDGYDEFMDEVNIEGQ